MSKNKERVTANRKLFCYSPTKVRCALSAIGNGMSVLKASKTYGVPRTTLRHKLKGQAPITSGRVGPESILGPTIEQILVDWVLSASRMGFPISRESLLSSVKKLVESENIKTTFTNKTPGRKWFEGFMKRHPILSMKKAEYLSKTRAAVTEEFVRKWFHDIRNLLKDDLQVFNDPRRVFNMDETAMCLAPKGGLVLAEKGKTTYDVSTSSDKENITTLFTVNAAGEIAPPLTVFKYERLPQTCLNKAPSDWSIGKTENGWMTHAAFFEYFTNVFHKYLQDRKISRPVIVFLDGHVSHMSYHLSSFCKEHDIILCCLPPNATHLLQPLDVSFFGPLKKHWQKFLKTWRINHNGIDVQKFDVPTALSEIIKKENFIATITAGFKCCGLYPFNPNGINYDKFLKQSITFNHDKSEPNIDKSRLENEQLAFKYLEKNINSNILQKFKTQKNNNLPWNGEIEYSALFDTWSKIYDDIYSKNTIADETFQIDDSIQICFEKTDDVLNDKHEVENQNFADFLQSPGNVTANLDYPVVLTEAVNAEPNQNPEQLKIEAQEILSDSSIITTDLPMIDNVNIIDVSANNCDNNNSSSNNNNSSCSSNTNNNNNKNNNDDANNNDHKNCADTNDRIMFNRTNSLEKVLKNIIVWPAPKPSKKRGLRKEHLPSVLTSDKWLEVMKAKEDEKQMQLQRKAEANKKKLEKREYLKQIKLTAKRIKIEKKEKAEKSKLAATRVKLDKKGEKKETKVEKIKIRAKQIKQRK